MHAFIIKKQVLNKKKLANRYYLFVSIIIDSANNLLIKFLFNDQFKKY